MKKLILLSIYLCFFTLSAQQAGDLDTSFAQNGIGVTNISEANPVTINSQATQSDGKIILAGSYNNGVESKAYVKRLNNNGTIDFSFSDNGSFLSNILTNVYKVKIQYDGKILLSSAKKIIRLDSDGTIDTSFNNIISDFFIGGIEVQWFDKIIVSYSIPNPFFGSNSSTQIARYFSDGFLDTSFGVNGFYSTSNSLSSMLLLPNQKILFSSTFSNSPSTYSGWSVVVINSNGEGASNLCGEAGYYPFSGLSYFRNFYFQPDNKILVVSSNKIRRYNQDFSIDTTFGNYGTLESTYPYDTRIKTTTEGKIVVLLNYVNTVFLVRYNNNGTYDSSFDGDGVFEFPLVSYNYTFGQLNVFNDDSFVLLPSLDIVTLFKFNSNGVIDSSFGDGGQKIISEIIDSNDKVTKSLMQTDEKLLLCGEHSVKATLNSAIIRYNIDGSIDTSYGDQGKFVYNFNYQKTVDVGIQSNDKVIISLKNKIYRINSSGIIDSSFGNNGYQQFSTSNYYSDNFIVKSLKVLSDDKILLLAQHSNNNNIHFIIKLNQNGSIDTSFNGSGYVFSDMYSSSNTEQFETINVLNNGKIIIGGSNQDINNPQSLIARFNSDGTKDINFGVNGIFILNNFPSSIPAGNYSINLIDIQNDDKIIINMRITDSNIISIPNGFLLARVNTNGTLDTSFGTNGIVQTPIENSCNSNFVKVLPNQKILAVGYSTGSSTNFAMVKYNTDGSLDTSFGNQGKVTTSFWGKATASSLVLTNDNKVLVSGTALNPLFWTNDFAYAKYHLEGSLGMEENNPNNTILIFPNPTHNLITFNQEVKTVSVYTLDGKLLNAQVVNNQIDLSGFNQGIYLVRGTTNDGVSFSEKLVKN